MQSSHFLAWSPTRWPILSGSDYRGWELKRHCTIADQRRAMLVAGLSSRWNYSILVLKNHAAKPHLLPAILISALCLPRTSLVTCDIRIYFCLLEFHTPSVPQTESLPWLHFWNQEIFLSEQPHERRFLDSREQPAAPAVIQMQKERWVHEVARKSLSKASKLCCLIVVFTSVQGLPLDHYVRNQSGQMDQTSTRTAATWQSHLLAYL